MSILRLSIIIRQPQSRILIIDFFRAIKQNCKIRIGLIFYVVSLAPKKRYGNAECSINKP